LALLKDHPRHIRHPQILLNQYGDTYQRGESFAEVFNKHRERLEIRYRSPYNVRHTAATMMLEAGMRPGYCAKQLGHSTQMFFNTYAEWIDKDEGEAQHNIWKAYA
jgi:integrase